MTSTHNELPKLQKEPINEYGWAFLILVGIVVTVIAGMTVLLTWIF